MEYATHPGKLTFEKARPHGWDEIAIAEYLKTLAWVNPDQLSMIGMSHGGEMALKIVSEYNGFAAAVASEPASHEFLALKPDETAFINEDTGLRNIEEMQMAEVEKVRERIDMPLAMKRVETIDTPILVMGRDEDHLQGIFRTSYDLLIEGGKNADWVSFDHDYHGYIFPVRGDDGNYILNEVQKDAVSFVISWLKQKMK